jgi:5-methylcytosine-specific restriction protein A
VPDRLFGNCRESGCCERTNSASGFCTNHEKSNSRVEQARERDKFRAQQPYRKLYHSAWWRKLRKYKLSLNPVCENLVFGEPCHNWANTVHHKIDHKGNTKLFCDLSNLQSLCKSCHDALREKNDQLFESSIGEKNGTII